MKGHHHHRISFPLYLLSFLGMMISILCASAHPVVPDSDKTTTTTATTATTPFPPVKVVKRDLQLEEDDEENVNRAVLPMVISKRSATALGKLMHLLRTSMDHSGGRVVGSSREKFEGTLNVEVGQMESFPTHMNSANYEMMFNLQRRNQKSNYLRCYFNAVSCF